MPASIISGLTLHVNAFSQVLGGTHRCTPVLWPLRQLPCLSTNSPSLPPERCRSPENHISKLVQEDAPHVLADQTHPLPPLGVPRAVAPEEQTAQIAAKEREVKSTKRAYWLPEFTIGGRYTDNLRQSGAGAGPTAGEGLTDWNVGVQATLPIFSGGLKKANASRAEFELRQLRPKRSQPKSE